MSIETNQSRHEQSQESVANINFRDTSNTNNHNSRSHIDEDFKSSIISINKKALDLLKQDSPQADQQSFDLLKQCERMVVNRIISAGSGDDGMEIVLTSNGDIDTGEGNRHGKARVSEKKRELIGLLTLTLNNIACYYKKYPDCITVGRSYCR